MKSSDEVIAKEMKQLAQRDPFIMHGGSIDTDILDLADEHDKYLGENLMERSGPKQLESTSDA